MEIIALSESAEVSSDSNSLLKLPRRRTFKLSSLFLHCHKHPLSYTEKPAILSFKHVYFRPEPDNLKMRFFILFGLAIAATAAAVPAGDDMSLFERQSVSAS